MTARQAAIRDIQDDLRQNHKCFIAFKRELNPVMDKLVRNQLEQQNILNLFHPHSKADFQLEAHCFFSKANQSAVLTNYDNYYRQ